MFQNASRIVAVLLGLLDQHLYLFHTPSQRDESQGQSLSTAYWWPIAPQYPPSRGWHHPSSFQEQPSIAQSDYIYYGMEDNRSIQYVDLSCRPVLWLNSTMRLINCVR